MESRLRTIQELAELNPPIILENLRSFAEFETAMNAHPNILWDRIKTEAWPNGLTFYQHAISQLDITFTTMSGTQCEGDAEKIRGLMLEHKAGCEQELDQQALAIWPKEDPALAIENRTALLSVMNEAKKGNTQQTKEAFLKFKEYLSEKSKTLSVAEFNWNLFRLVGLALQLLLQNQREPKIQQDNIDNFFQYIINLINKRLPLRLLQMTVGGDIKPAENAATQNIDYNNYYLTPIIRPPSTSIIGVSFFSGQVDSFAIPFYDPWIFINTINQSPLGQQIAAARNSAPSDADAKDAKTHFSQQLTTLHFQKACLQYRAHNEKLRLGRARVDKNIIMICSAVLTPVIVGVGIILGMGLAGILTFVTMGTLLPCVFACSILGGAAVTLRIKNQRQEISPEEQVLQGKITAIDQQINSTLQAQQTANLSRIGGGATPPAASAATTAQPLQKDNVESKTSPENARRRNSSLDSSDSDYFDTRRLPSS